MQFLHPPVTSTLMDPNIFPSKLLSDTLGLCFGDTKFHIKQAQLIRCSSELPTRGGSAVWELREGANKMLHRDRKEISV